ncbi:MAG TPA: hypothetical protein VND64_06960, partial [Pirellulales bacterium]|nr:hypothetical protein [Pirellulales bacterium]
MAVPVTKGEHWDVTLDARNMLHIRIHGQERQKLTLAAGEERVLDVWRSRLSTIGLPEGAYKVAIRMPDDDVPQPPPLGLRLTASSKPAQSVPRDFKASAVPADDDKPVNNPETIVWGEPVLGLQAGVRFSTAGACRKLGETIETEVFLCNTNSHNVEIEYLHHTPLDFAPQVRDASGREIKALLMVSGPKFNESRILPPNEPVLIGKSQFWVQSPKGGSREFPSVVAPPGKYHYSTGLHIGDTNLNYVGIQLTTGELPLELVAADDGDETATEAIDGKADGPAKTVFAFLEAVRIGNGTEA